MASSEIQIVVEGQHLDSNDVLRDETTQTPRESVMTSRESLQTPRKSKHGGRRKSKRSATSASPRSPKSRDGLTARSETSTGSVTSKPHSSTGESDEEGEDFDSDFDIVLESVSCGNAHTLLVTENGTVLACGNHRYGQLGIDEKKIKINIEMCGNCTKLQATLECKDCKHTGKYHLCKSCDTILHAPKAVRFHERHLIPPPRNTRFKCDLCQVKTMSSDLEFGLLSQDLDANLGNMSSEMRKRDFKELPGSNETQPLCLVKAVACGDAHSLAIVETIAEAQENRSTFMMAWGCGSSGRTGLCKIDGDQEVPHIADEFIARIAVSFMQVDDEEAEDANVMNVLALPFRPIQVACGGQHNVALCSSNKLCSWGNGEYGQLGRDIDNYFCHSIVEVPLPQSIIVSQIACGDIHTLITANDGAVFSCGCGSHGRLGHGDTENCTKLREIQHFPNPKPKIIHVAGGACHSAAVSEDGNLFCWGQNDSGQCGPFKITKVGESKFAKPTDILKPALVELPTKKRSGTTESDTASRLETSSFPTSQGTFSRRAQTGRPSMQLSARNATTKGAASASSVGKSTRAPFESTQDTYRSRPMSQTQSQVSREGLGAPHQVACGQCHTLALIFGELWILGSGLDLRDRLQNVELEKEAGKPDTPILASCFKPRCIKTVFLDTSEIYTKPDRAFVGADEGTENVSYERVIHSKVKEEIPAEDEDEDPNKMITKLHDCFTFTFHGQLEIKAGDEVAFTGPKVPNGLRLYSALDGPFFKILGKPKDKRTPPWQWELGPNMKEDDLEKLELSEIKELPDGVFFNKGETIHCQHTDVQAQVARFDQSTKSLLIGRSTVILPKKSHSKKFKRTANRPFHPDDIIKGKHSEAEAKVKEHGPCDPPEKAWLGGEGYDHFHKFSIEAPQECLTPVLNTFEKVAEWISQNVALSNSENMVVCKKAKLPAMKQISSGAFHACALTVKGSVLIWGKGSLGRLGTGNELDQLVPTINEIETADVGIQLKINMDLEIEVESIDVKYQEEQRKMSHSGVNASHDIQPGDIILEIDRIPINSINEDTSDAKLRRARRYFQGLVDSFCIIKFRKKEEQKLENEDDESHSEQPIVPPAEAAKVHIFTVHRQRIQLSED